MQFQQDGSIESATAFAECAMPCLLEWLDTCGPVGGPRKNNGRLLQPALSLTLCKA